MPTASSDHIVFYFERAPSDDPGKPRFGYSADTEKYKAELEKNPPSGPLGDFGLAMVYHPETKIKGSIALDPNASIAHLRLQQIDHDTSFTIEAMRLDPMYAEAYNNRGFCYQQMQHHHLAIPSYDTALRIRPEYVTALNNRATARAETGDLDGARRDLDRALSISATMFLALNNRGILHLTQDKPDLAIADFDRAIAERPDWGHLYLNRGYAHEAMGDHSQAAIDFRAATEIDPELTP